MVYDPVHQGWKLLIWYFILPFCRFVEYVNSNIIFIIFVLNNYLPMQKTWYAVYTKPRNEKKVAFFFERDGVEHYLPLMQRIKLWSDRKKKVEEPLFPSYIFVYIDEREHLKVLRTQGVVRFVTFEGKKIPIREVQIEAIRRYAETGEEFLVNEGDYTVGKKVKVSSGSMKGLEGKLVEILGKQRVKVEIEAIGQSVFIQIPKGSLEIIGEYSEEGGEYW